jgi:exoribonuclease R
MSRSRQAPVAPRSVDLRGLLWCSIDNDESRDLDQLSVAEPMAGGTVRTRVAVADAIVGEGSAIDSSCFPRSSRRT